MRLIFASDSFKGSLTSENTIRLLTQAAKKVFGECECVGVPLADGGEGTVDALIASGNGKKVFTRVHGPLGEELEAGYGVLNTGCAVIEMSAASGLTLVPAEKRDPRHTTSLGTGELILHALDAGYRDIYIAIGGSATNDGGMGCVSALGARFLDSEGRALSGCGRELINVSHIDIARLDPRIKKTRVTVMCDVTNPLCGEHGATMTFGRQKGATDVSAQQLEAGMQNYRDVIKREFGADCDSIPGAGAADGLGAALSVFLHGNMRSGIETVLKLNGFDQLLDAADLVVTGEGCTDSQSCFGKVMQGVGMHARAKGVPVLGLSGSLGAGAMDICMYGVSSLMSTVNAPMPLMEAMSRAEELYLQAAERMFRFVRVGMEMKNGRLSV